ncbi:retropepsin-like aspartic protease [Umboniibacter marinipuniceus]|uniref:Aspartyl protease n=1 Tax=Umboniibacter marinipuniceus TaxID=569599 RepID=A0A3M0A4A1_9GAMM|nr:retropepsin-like aspartic protease [Umboniibacter marinipuniceus]RMA79496.1 aspartyl protease [Umboniibacter marinipuniceus]
MNQTSIAYRFLSTLALVSALLLPAKALHAEDLHALLSDRGYVAIELTENRFGHFVAHGQLNSNPVDILVDSGATTTVVDRSFVERINAATRESTIRAVGLGGSQGYLEIVDFNSFSLGDQFLDANDMKVMNLEHINRVYRSNEVRSLSAIIGSDYLKAHNAIIDYDNNLLWLQPSAS